MENLKEALPPGMADAAMMVPGFGALAQILLSKLGLDAGNTMSFYLLLFGIWQGAMYVYRTGRGYLL